MSDALSCPSDIDTAHGAWGANCGPTALAALLGLDVADVREAFNAGGPRPGYTNPTRMVAAASELGLRLVPVGEVIPSSGRGLIFIQFTGPWERYPREAYKHTHWIAFAWAPLLGVDGLPEGEPLLFTYDCNWGPFGAWMPLDVWERVLAPRLVQGGRRGESGFRHGEKGWRWRRVFAVG